MISPEEADALAARLLGGLRTKLGDLQVAHARRVAAGVSNTGDDRVIADDSGVASTAAGQIRREACSRLTQLERLGVRTSEVSL